MESQVSKIYALSTAAGRQLPITEFAHKAAVVGDRGVGAVLAARDVSPEGCRTAVLDGAHHLTDDVGGHLGVARRGVELGMSEQS